jgi:NAD(P)-dependent dehydrogenase (short-subunit alcohol dehydrogenase family)
VGRLDGKVAIVTGAARGQGEAEARRFVAEGAKVVVSDVLDDQGQAVAADLGDDAVWCHLDVSDPAEWDRVVATAVERFGRLDGLVNNAFRMDTFEPFDAVDLGKWRKIFEVNVWGALGLTQTCIPHLKKAAAEHGDASVVFIISMSMRNIRPLEGGYSSSKAAIQTAAKTMAVELGPTGVRVNCVAPGWIGGPNVEVFIGWESESRGISRDDVRAEIEARIPLRLIPPQDEIANSVVFFVSPWSKVVTGQTLDVNGGEFLGA